MEDASTFAVIGATIADNFDVEMPENTIGYSVLENLQRLEENLKKIKKEKNNGTEQNNKHGRPHFIKTDINMGTDKRTM